MMTLAKPSVVETSYLSDLKKKVEISRENIKKVNEGNKQQAILMRNQEREALSFDYYEKGLRLETKGNWSDARYYFEKALRLMDHPEMVDYQKEVLAGLNDKIKVALLDFKQQTQDIRPQRKAEVVLLKEKAIWLKQMKEHARAYKKKIMHQAAVAYRQAIVAYKAKRLTEAQNKFRQVNEMVAHYKATDRYLARIDGIIKKGAL